MAAHEKFESFTATLAPEDKSRLADVISGKRKEILAARSEDARVRLVQDYVREIHDRLMKKK